MLCFQLSSILVISGPSIILSLRELELEDGTLEVSVGILAGVGIGISWASVDLELSLV